MTSTISSSAMNSRPWTSSRSSPSVSTSSKTTLRASGVIADSYPRTAASVRTAPPGKGSRSTITAGCRSKTTAIHSIGPALSLEGRHDRGRPQGRCRRSGGRDARRSLGARSREESTGPLGPTCATDTPGGLA
ncbi:hypothetical protein J2T23_000591 [Pseudarthrobacter niigatensis]|uniref:Uncharacterized protein n=1 Tax=Pseudarthrobacter niigatensis TaxID=369935 RepID=A0AAJ1WE84_9MICC|nr:hypothetical protein [Pseudarthrobacter niigatensis]MDQ0265363.1 hypothetical protein [Pseudarthrobacter niigatensis]